MADDDITLQIKLEWTQRRLEESEQLVKSLRASLNNLSEINQEQTQRSTILGHRQDELIAEKHVLETRIDELIKEKSELAAENASLRSVTRESAQRASLLQTADQLMAAQSGDGAAAGEANLAGKLAGSRLLLSRLLWIIHRAGLRLQERDLLGPLTVLEGESGLGAGLATEGAAREQQLKEEVAVSLINSLGIGAAVAARVSESSSRSAGEQPQAQTQAALAPAASQGGTQGQGQEGQVQDAVGTAEQKTAPAVPAESVTAPAKPVGWFGSLFSLLVGGEEGPPPTLAPAAVAGPS